MDVFYRRSLSYDEDRAEDPSLNERIICVVWRHTQPSSDKLKESEHSKWSEYLNLSHLQSSRWGHPKHSLRLVYSMCCFVLGNMCSPIHDNTTIIIIIIIIKEVHLYQEYKKREPHHKEGDCIINLQISRAGNRLLNSKQMMGWCCSRACAVDKMI